MSEISGFPYVEVELTKEGSPVDAGQRDDAVAMAGTVTDLMVISHGWNNDMAEARRLYTELTSSMARDLDEHPPPAYGDRELGVVGVLWPSKKFAESDLIPGGAASVGGGADQQAVAEELDALEAFLEDPGSTTLLEEAKGLLDELEDRADARRRFVELVRGALRHDETDDEDASEEFFDMEHAEELLDRLQRPVRVGRPRPDDETGGAAGLGDTLAGIWRGGRNLLNYATYYEMKARSGTVGKKGIAPLLDALHAAHPEARLHLVGHSFGARAVTVAAAEADAPVTSLSLLQAAFSHYGFAADWEPGKDGLFRAVLATARIDGPTIITHTVNDKAVGVAYAIASRVAGQVASAVGDADDKYGGLGRNGAQKTPDVVKARLEDAGATYEDFGAHTVHNLRADDFIADHGSVRGREVANAVLWAMSAT